MKQIFRIEKVNCMSENLDFTAVQLRVKLFNKVVFKFLFAPKKKCLITI